MLGHAAKRDKEKENHGFSVKRKERWNPIVIRGKFLSSNKIVLNVLFMLDNYPLKTHTHTHTHSYNHIKHIIMFFTLKIC